MSRKCSGFVIVMLVAALGATLLAQVQGSKSAGKSNDTEQKLSQWRKISGKLGRTMTWNPLRKSWPLSRSTSVPGE